MKTNPGEYMTIPRSLALLLVGVAVAGSLVWAFNERRILNMYWFSLTTEGVPPALLDKTNEGVLVRWVDDYFTIERIAPATFAIGEPRYHQQNYSYLIIGMERALLFDAGPGIRDIRATAESLTDLPITWLPSHFHYDHVGNGITFERIAVVDLPYLRKRAPDNLLTLTKAEHLGMAEGFTIPTWRVDTWLAVGEEIDLGQRSLKLLYTPGHTTDSVSLFDAANNIVFSGDYIYPGYLYGFLPNSSMGDYLRGARTLLADVPENATIFGAHRRRPPGAPSLKFDDLQDLERGLNAIRDGEIEGQGTYPQTFSINERISMLAEPRWLQDWD